MTTDKCLHEKGHRYGGTVRRSKATIANGMAGKVIMICRSCGAIKYV